MRATRSALVVLLAMGSTALVAQTPMDQAPMDPDFAAKVKEWTTRPEYNSPLTDQLPLSGSIPSPVKYLGEHIGQPRTLHYHSEIIGYFRALAAADPARVHVIDIGKTNEGRDNIIVMISSARNISSLPAIKANLARLADPRGLDEAEARRLVRETKPIYHITAGLHSNETGPPEMVMELAYRLLAQNNEMTNRILDNVVVAFSPVMEGDGRDRYVDWYYRHLIDIDDDLKEKSRPPYWGKYIYHDNNRDINYSDISAQQFLKYFLEWHPPIMHDMHESIPFLYTYSAQAPQNPDLDPIVYGEMPWIANYEMAQLTKFGMPGVWTHGFMDAWSPGYIGETSMNHNGMLRMYETYNNDGATTMKRRIKNPNDPNEEGGFSKIHRREWYRPLPPYEETMWSMRNNINYMQTAALSALDLVASKPAEIVDGFYRKSRNSVAAGTASAPYAYIIPGGQADRSRVAWMVDRLRDQGIEIGQLNGPVTVKEGKYPAGSLIIKLNQPYGRLAKTYLRLQKDYPNEKIGTYDDTGWNLALTTGTEVVEIADKAILDAPATPIDRYAAAGRVSGSQSSPVFVIPDYGSAAMATLRFQLNGADVAIAEQPFSAAGKKMPAGSFIISGNGAAQAPALASGLGLEAVGLGRAPSVASHPAATPRVALYSTWGWTQDVGWWRYTFDKHKIPYTLIYKEQVREGNLAQKYDVVIIPSQARDAKTIVFDIPMTGKPLPYTKTDQYKFQGDYGSSEDIRGGMGLPGLAELERFVQGGGTLITTGTASGIVTGFNLAPYIDAKPPKGDFYAPGPIVNMKVLQPRNPIFYGYDKQVLPVRWATSSLYSVPVQHAANVLARFPGGRKNVLSGLMRGPELVKDNAAIVTQQVGQGRVVMFATNPVWRWQTLGEFRMLYNALLNYPQLEMGKDPVPVPAADAPAKPEHEDQ